MRIDLRIFLGLQAPANVVDRSTVAGLGQLERALENVKLHCVACSAGRRRHQFGSETSKWVCNRKGKGSLQRAGSEPFLLRVFVDPPTATDSQGVSVPVTIAFHRLPPPPMAVLALSQSETIQKC